MADSHTEPSNKDITSVEVENEKADKPKEDKPKNDHKQNEEQKSKIKDDQIKDELKEGVKRTEADKKVTKDEDNAKKNKKGHAIKVAKFGVIAMAILIIINAIILLPISLLATAVTKALDPDRDHTGRSSGMIIIAVAATISLVLAIYAIIVAAKEKRKHLHGIGLAFLIIAILLTVVAASNLNVSPDSEVETTRKMIESFKLANDHNPRHVKQWDYYQDKLNCCGIYGPDDYRHGLPPFLPADVPASCCPYYDVSSSEADLEKLRNECKSLRKYHTQGCKAEVVETLSDAATLVQQMSIVLIIFLFVEGPLGLVLAKLLKPKPKEDQKSDENSPQKKSNDETTEQKV